MRKLMMAMLVLALALAGGCGGADGDSGEKLFADMSANMREMAAVLTSVTDEASAMEAMGLHPRLVPGGAQNFKVTYPEDFVMAEAVLRGRAR